MFLLAFNAPKVSKYMAFLSRSDHKFFELTVILFNSAPFWLLSKLIPREAVSLAYAYCEFNLTWGF